MTLFMLQLTVGGERFNIHYETLDQCLDDRALMTLLDSGRGSSSAECVLWMGDQRISGVPLKTSEKLRECVVANSQPIMMQKLPRGGR